MIQNTKQKYFAIYYGNSNILRPTLIVEKIINNKYYVINGAWECEMNYPT